MQHFLSQNCFPYKQCLKRLYHLSIPEMHRYKHNLNHETCSKIFIVVLDTGMKNIFRETKVVKNINEKEATQNHKFLISQSKRD